MTIRQSFFDNCNLNKTWNKVIEWQGVTLGTVRWHTDREWKLLERGTTFDDVKDRSYKPLAEFHTQQELWQYIKENNLVEELVA